MPQPQFVSRMLAESVGHIRIDDPPALRLAMSRAGDRPLRGDRLLDDTPQAVPAGRALPGVWQQLPPDQRVLRTVDIEIETERQEMVVIDRDEVRRDQRAGLRLRRRRWV